MSINKNTSLGNAFILFGVMVWPIIAYRIPAIKNLPQDEINGLLIMLAGYFLLLVSKAPQIKNFDLFTFGVKGMNKYFKCMYVLSYIVMISGFLVLLRARG